MAPPFLVEKIILQLAFEVFINGEETNQISFVTRLLLKAGYAYVPYSSLEGVIENSKDGYYLALRQTQGTIRTVAPNWQPWLIFSLRAFTSTSTAASQWPTWSVPPELAATR
jgi:hypothetical protein